VGQLGERRGPFRQCLRPVHRRHDRERVERTALRASDTGKTGVRAIASTELERPLGVFVCACRIAEVFPQLRALEQFVDVAGFVQCSEGSAIVAPSPQLERLREAHADSTPAWSSRRPGEVVREAGLPFV